jgi:hypothetical protein
LDTLDKGHFPVTGVTIQKMYLFSSIIVQIGHTEILLEHNGTVFYALLQKLNEMGQFLSYNEISALWGQQK